MAIITDPGVLLYTRIRKSPYFHASRQHGVALYSVYNHTYHPRHYGDPVDEYWHLLEHSTLWDVGVEKQVEITGPDAFDFTNMLVPRDLTKCKVGQCKYVFITDQDGGILNDPVLLRLGENHFWLSVADTDVLLWARALAHGLGMDVTITEPDVGPLQIQGPKSANVMVELFGDSILEIPYYHAQERELDGMSLVVSRTGYTSELGYEVYLRDASQHGVRLWNTILEAGAPHDLRPIGPCHIRRIEGGILSHGADMWYDTNPFEVGYGFEATWMVDLDQEADFIGKEALKRIRDEGISRKLVGVEIGGPSVGSYNDGAMIEPFPVRDGDTLVGEVTSACHSPRLDKNIGFAMVPLSHAELGTPLTIETTHGSQEGVVVEKPFIDPGKETPKRLGPAA